MTVKRGICPFAILKEIPPGVNDPQIKPRIAILHVDSGNAFSLFEFFRDRSGGVESHFHIRKDGEIEQYRNIFWQADANLHANDFAVSIETQGDEFGEWNALQLASIKRLFLWLNKETNGAIPIKKCESWNGSGIGYHVMFGAPGPWAPKAKSCPGPDRVKQFFKIIVPWINSNPQENEMTPEDRQLIIDGVLDGLDLPTTKMQDPKKELREWSLNTLLWAIYRSIRRCEAKLNQLLAK